MQGECQERSHWEEKEYGARGGSVDDIGLHLGFKRRIECGHMETREPTLQEEETI